MFCPKCGSENTTETRFCRGCGSDISDVASLVGGRAGGVPVLAEKQIQLFSSGIRGLVIGIGLVAVAIVAYGISARAAVLVIFALAFASLSLGIGISRLVQARGLRKLRELRASEPAPTLPAGEPEYPSPPRSIYETDDLLTPRSVTEHTTTHLKIRAGDSKPD